MTIHWTDKIDFISCDDGDDSYFNGIENLTNLSDVSICDSFITDNLADNISFEEMRSLSILSCQGITYKFFEKISQSKISRLSFSDCDCSYAACQQISKIKTLTHLTLSNTDITDSCLELFATLPKLTTLNVSGCFNVTGRGLRMLRAKNLSLYIEHENVD